MGDIHLFAYLLRVSLCRFVLLVLLVLLVCAKSFRKRKNKKFKTALITSFILPLKTNFNATLSSLNREVTASKTKPLLVENELKKLKTFDSNYFIAESHFEDDGIHDLVFQPMYRYFKIIAGLGNERYIYYWQSKGLPNERINSITVSYYNVTPFLDYYGTKTRVQFSGSCLKQDKVTFNHGKIVNIYIAYEISKSINISDYLTLINCLFEAVSVTKIVDIGRYGYSGYGIEFDRHGSFSFPGTGLGRNVITFGVDMSSSAKIDNRKRDVLILGKGPA